MREHRGEHECRGDLVARERRGELSSADRIALGVHLETCPSCRMTRDIHADFEAETAVELDDATRIARLSSAARRWSQRRARPRARGERRGGRWQRVALGLAGLLMLAGSASATAWWWAESREAKQEQRAALPPPAFTRQRIAAPARRSAPVIAPAPLAISEPELPVPAVLAEPRPARPRLRAVAALAPRETAATVLRRADEARRRGESEAALALYRRLQSEYPATREAVLSLVPLGGLLLHQGQATRAAEQFDRYLAAEPHGNLIPEALYGRGRALAAVGQREAERQTWRRLIEQSPGSAYEPHARRRLVELQ